jgi:hypothetical protein
MNGPPSARIDHSGCRFPRRARGDSAPTPGCLDRVECPQIRRRDTCAVPQESAFGEDLHAPINVHRERGPCVHHYELQAGLCLVEHNFEERGSRRRGTLLEPGHCRHVGDAEVVEAAVRKTALTGFESRLSLQSEGAKRRQRFLVPKTSAPGRTRMEVRLLRPPPSD